MTSLAILKNLRDFIKIIGKLGQLHIDYLEISVIIYFSDQNLPKNMSQIRGGLGKFSYFLRDETMRPMEKKLFSSYKIILIVHRTYIDN